MFNTPDELYPTPFTLAHSIANDVMGYFKQNGSDIRDKAVLDPSAGTGALLSPFEGYRWKRYAIEIDDNLRAALEAKSTAKKTNYWSRNDDHQDPYEIRVIGEDFLAYQSSRRFDAIVMNPPFSDSTSHFLKAWEVMQNGIIVCLMNSARIDNPTAEDQVMLNIIADNGGEITRLGKAFSGHDAQRKTNVDVAKVKVVKRSADGFNFDFEAGFRPVIDANDDVTALMSSNVAEALVATFNATIAAYTEVIKAKAKTRKIAMAMKLPYNRVEATCDKYCADNFRGEFDDFYDAMLESAWQSSLNHPALNGIMSAKVREQFEEFRRKQRHIEFTVSNIAKMFDRILSSQGDIVNQIISDAFDLMTKFHTENRVHVEGWVNDKAWRVNHKVILPNMVDAGSSYVDHRKAQEMDDIDRALCAVAGDKKFEEIVKISTVLGERLRERQARGYQPKEKDNEVESEFFNIRFFQKGTIHLIFKNRDLLARFNQKAADGRGWLPPKSK